MGLRLRPRRRARITGYRRRARPKPRPCGNLQGAFLWDANLQDTNIWGVNLQDANLEGANLQDAKLWKADLQRAGLWNADLQRANFLFANLQGAHLERRQPQEARILTQEQLNAANGDDRTQLPKGFTRPAHWSGAAQPGPAMRCRWSERRK